MHEPSVVTISMSSSETKNSPGSTLTASFLKLESQKKNDASPASAALRATGRAARRARARRGRGARDRGRLHAGQTFT